MDNINKYIKEFVDKSTYVPILSKDVIKKSRGKVLRSYIPDYSNIWKTVEVYDPNIEYEAPLVILEDRYYGICIESIIKLDKLK